MAAAILSMGLNSTGTFAIKRACTKAVCLIGHICRP